MKHITRILFIFMLLFSTAQGEYFHYSSSDVGASGNYAAMISCAVAGGLCSAITLGPVSCSVSALAAGVYLLYSWLRSPQEQEAQQDLRKQDDAQAQSSHNAHIYHRVYVLDDKAMTFLADNTLNIHDYQSCFGTAIQHVLHQECIELVHNSARLAVCENTIASQAILADAIDAGRSCAHSNLIDKAHVALDWARALLRYAQAVGNGVLDGAQQTLHSFTHPRQFVAHLSHDAHEIVCVTMRMFYEYGLIETLIDIDNDALLEAYIIDRSAYLRAMAQHIAQCAKEITKPGGVRTAVASATHVMLTGKCLHVLGKFFSFAARNASSMIMHIGDVAAIEPGMMAATADGILINAAHESAQLAFRAAEEQLPKAKMMHAISAYEPPAVCIERLAKKYPQWATDNCKPLVHILKGHDVKGRLSGLHHDYGGYLEALGHIEVLEHYPSGMYKGKVLYNGKKIEKTFFPKAWTPEQLIHELDVSMQRISEWKIEEGRKIGYAIIADTKVRFVLEIDSRIVTIYPRFE